MKPPTLITASLGRFIGSTVSEGVIAKVAMSVAQLRIFIRNSFSEVLITA